MQRIFGGVNWYFP